MKIRLILWLLIYVFIPAALLQATLESSSPLAGQAPGAEVGPIDEVTDDELETKDLAPAPLVADAAAEAVREGLRKLGYFISPQMPLSQEVERGLKELFLDPGRKDYAFKGDAHEEATHSYWQMEVDLCSKEILFLAPPKESADAIPATIKAFAKEVLSYLGDGRYFLQINLFNDFGKWVRESEKKLNDLGPSAKPAIEALPVEPIRWHQDKFGPGRLSFDHVFFKVFRATGILNNQNKLELATGPAPALASNIKIGEVDAAISIGDEHADVIESIEGATGAGYFVDQNFVPKEGRVFVHRHTGLKTIVSNCDLTDEPLDFPFFEDCKRPKNNHNFLSPDYERPARETLVVRIKRLDSKE